VTFEPVSYPASQPALPALQSFAALASPASGEWLIFGGLTGGAHSFSGGGYSPFIYVLDPAAGRCWKFDVRLLPAGIGDALLCDNAQMAHDPATNTGYLIGGFGLDRSSRRFTTFRTVTAFPVDDLIAAIKSPCVQPSNIEALLKRSSDSRFGVAGGGIVSRDAAFYLMFGQKFKGPVPDPVSPTSVQEYTEEIRHFRMDPAGAAIVESSYGAIVDPGDHSFHRRDLCVVPGFDPDTGAGRIAAFGGVFQFGQMQPFTNPVYVDAVNAALVENRFSQKMNLYECPVIPAYDEGTQTMSYTFFGGIAGWQLGPGNQLRQDGNLPWSNQAAMVINAPGGQYREIVLPGAIPGGLCVGADAQFHFLAGLQTAGRMYPNGVLKLSAFVPGAKTPIGYIFGGVEAATPDTPSEKTVASNRVFAVYLTNSPTPGVRVG
jgi:hypothetical protein